MKKIIIIVMASAILLSFHTFAFSRSPEYEWTTQDTILQSTVTAVLTIDWLQSRSSLEYKENNPLFGEDHPSKRKFDIFFASYIFIHLGISYILPQNYRTIWQSLWIGAEIACIHNNYSCGVKIKF
jgi:hypothetical protein